MAAGDDFFDVTVKAQLPVEMMVISSEPQPNNRTIKNNNNLSIEEDEQSRNAQLPST